MSAALNESPRKRGRTGQKFAVAHGQSASPGKSSIRGGRTGPVHTGTHADCASPKLNSGRRATVTHFGPAREADKSRAVIDTQAGSVLIGQIIIRHREYRGLQQASGDMVRRIKSAERWNAAIRQGRLAMAKGDKFPPVTEQDEEMVKREFCRWQAGLKHNEGLTKECGKELLGLLEGLPPEVLAWTDQTKGFARMSLAAIVAHAGNLSDYSNPAKLWKRFSLHVVDGKASKRVRGDASQSFVPARRAEMHVIGECLLRAGGEYAQLYRDRKQHEIAKAHALGLEVKPAARITAKNANKCISEGLIHKRSLRYIEKRLLRELWRTSPKPLVTHGAANNA